MKRPELIRHLKSLADDGQIQLREKAVDTSEGGLMIVHARILHQGAAVDGFGTAATREAAIDKALWETVERRFFRFTRFSPADFKPMRPIRRLIGALTGVSRLIDLDNLGGHSVGCAVHSSKSRAESAAVAELIERHTVLVAQLLSCAGLRIDCAPVRWNSMNLSISHFCWQGPLRTYCVLSEIRRQNDGRVLYSTGAGNSVEAACSKSTAEAMGLAENFEVETGEAPDLRSAASISDLKRWHMLNSNRKAFYRGAACLTAPPRIDDELDRDRFWTATTTLGAGLYFSRAYSPDTQNLFVGHWEPSRIHPRFRHLLLEGVEPPYAY